MLTIRQKCIFGFSAWTFMSVSLVTAHPKPTQESCSDMGAELPDFHAQGEAVVIRFPFLESAVSYWRLQMDNSTIFHISHSNRSDFRNHSRRIVQRERALWLLPSQPSDSGTYSYIFRSRTFCFTGEISVMIYETGREDMDMLTHPVSAQPDRDLTIGCPHIDHFKRAESPRWYKGFHSETFLLGSARHSTGKGDMLTIRNISVEDEGFYTCRLTVMINNTQYNVSRIWKLQVTQDPVTYIPNSNTEHTETESGDVASTTSSTVYPYITTPVNGSLIEGHLGFELTIQCKAFVGSQSLGHTEISWLINGLSLERSDLRGRAFQTNRKLSGGHIEAQLVLLKVREEDTSLELKCVAKNSSGKQQVVAQIKLKDSTFVWLVMAAIAGSFFLVVVSVFLRLLCCKSPKRNNYQLARQSSTF